MAKSPGKTKNFAKQPGTKKVQPKTKSGKKSFPGNAPKDAIPQDPPFPRNRNPKGIYRT